MKAIRGLLVDLDGTLVDTSRANHAAYAAALRPHGIELDWEWWQDHAFGRNWRAFLPKLLEGRENIDVGEVAQRKAQLYPSQIARSRLNSGLVALIASMRPAVRTALVTTASRTATEALLEFHGVRGLFDEIVTGDDVLKHKPDPAAYVLAAKRLGLAPAECLAFEDSETGISAARAFGAECVVVGAISSEHASELPIAC